jgi:protein TonB
MSSTKADALRRAEQLAVRGDFKAAISAYRALIEADPFDLNSIHSLTDLYVRAGYVQEALDELARVADRVMTIGPAIHAAPLLLRMLDLDPSNAPLRMKLARVYARAGRTEQAHQTMIEAGVAFTRKGNLVAAKEAIQSALTLKPDSTQARHALASLNQQAAPPSSPSPTAAPASKMRDTSELAELGKQLSASAADFSAADVTDEFVVRQLFAAELLAGCGSADKAVALLKRLLEFRPDAIDVRTKLKDIYLRADMITEASREFLEIARLYDSRGDAARAKDFRVRAERLAQPLSEPVRANSVKPMDARQVEKSDKKEDSIQLAKEIAREVPKEARIEISSSSDAVTRVDSAAVVADASRAVVQPSARRAGPSALGLLEPPPATDRSRSQRGGVVFYAVAAAIVVTLLSGWFFARRFYAAELDRAYQTLAQANSLPLPPQSTTGETFTMPHSEEHMDVRAESPSSSPNAAAPTSTASTPTHEEAAPHNESDKATATAAPANSNANPTNTGPAPSTSQPTAPPVAVVPNVATNTDRPAMRTPVGLPHADGSEPPPPPTETRKAAVIIKAEAFQRVQPDYPANARLARQSGTVNVELSINERGDVIGAQAVSGPSLLRPAAAAAARRWKFKPATRDGKPIASVSTIIFNFKL